MGELWQKSSVGIDPVGESQFSGSSRSRKRASVTPQNRRTCPSPFGKIFPNGPSVNAQLTGRQARLSGANHNDAGGAILVSIQRQGEALVIDETVLSGLPLESRGAF